MLFLVRHLKLFLFIQRTGPKAGPCIFGKGVLLNVPFFLFVFSDEVYEGDFTIGDHDSK